MSSFSTSHNMLTAAATITLVSAFATGCSSEASAEVAVNHAAAAATVVPLDPTTGLPTSYPGTSFGGMTITLSKAQSIASKNAATLLTYAPCYDTNGVAQAGCMVLEVRPTTSVNSSTVVLSDTACKAGATGCDPSLYLRSLYIARTDPMGQPDGSFSYTETISAGEWKTSTVKGKTTKTYKYIKVGTSKATHSASGAHRVDLYDAAGTLVGIACDSSACAGPAPKTAECSNASSCEAYVAADCAAWGDNVSRAIPILLGLTATVLAVEAAPLAVVVGLTAQTFTRVTAYTLAAATGLTSYYTSVVSGAAADNCVDRNIDETTGKCNADAKEEFMEQSCDGEGGGNPQVPTPTDEGPVSYQGSGSEVAPPATCNWKCADETMTCDGTGSGNTCTVTCVKWTCST